MCKMFRKKNSPRDPFGETSRRQQRKLRKQNEKHEATKVISRALYECSRQVVNAIADLEATIREKKGED